MNGLCNEGNATLYWCLERDSERDTVLSLSSLIPDALKGGAIH